MKKRTVSVVISAWNEERNIRRCLSSVTWADELIVIDNFSTDRTEQIAKEFTTRIWKRPNNLMLNVNKNYGFEKATGDWIISLDADEEIPAQLKKEIQDSVRSQDIAGFWIPRKNIIFGKWIMHGLWWPDRQLRMFRRGLGSFPEKHVHEYLDVQGKTENLREPYVHYNYETISQFIRKMDTIYTESEVQKLISSSYQMSWRDAIRFPFSDFIKIYFAQSGYKDGLHGLVLALLQSFYSFVVFAKLWERQKFSDIPVTSAMTTGEAMHAGKEYSYWDLTAQIKETTNPLRILWLKIKRRYRGAP